MSAMTNSDEICDPFFGITQKAMLFIDFFGVVGFVFLTVTSPYSINFESGYHTGMCALWTM